MNPTRLPGARRAAGFSLIEVLVSIFIVSLGILALAGLLQSASRYGKMSEMRSMATLMGNDIADRIRANAAGAASYELTSASYPTPAPPVQAACDPTHHCNPAQLAQADVYFWTQRLQKMLPGGSAYLKYNVGATPALGSVDVWVAWTDPATNVLGTTERGAAECPAAWSAVAATVRCLNLQVGL